MEYLLCPNCKHPLSFAGDSYFCENCESQFEIRQGIPILLPKTISQSTSLEAEAWDCEGRRGETALPLWRNLLFKEAAIQEFLDTMHHIKFNGRVLEVGTGSGWGSAIVKFYYPSSEVYATDVAVSSLVKARELSRLFNINIDKYMVVDVEGTPFPDDYFDIVFGCSILHHISNLAKGLAEIHRILKSGGTYFGTGEEMATRFWQHMAILSRAKKRVDEYGLPERIYTFGEWEKLFKVAGFDRLDILISKNPRYKYDSKVSFLYNLAISQVPNFIISRLLGSSINIIAKKSG